MIFLIITIAIIGWSLFFWWLKRKYE